MGRVIDVVVTLGLEEEMAGLARRHRDQPAEQRRHHRIDEYHHVGDQKTGSADEVQALVDAAVVIVAMVVPALGSQFLQEILDHFFSPKSVVILFTGIRCPPCDIIIMTYKDVRRCDDARDGCARQAAAATSILRKRTSEKRPSGGTRRRSTNSMPRAPASHLA